MIFGGTSHTKAHSLFVVLRQHVDPAAFDWMLSKLPVEAQGFWRS